MRATSLKTFLIDKRSSIKEAMRAIDRNGYGVVFAEDRKGVLVGSLSDGDIRKAILGGRSVNEPAEEIMNKKVVVVNENWDELQIKKFLKSDELAKRFQRHFVVPVQDAKGKVVDALFVFRGKYYSLCDAKKASPSRKLKNILVIGGAGYIGSVLSHLLVKRGYRVTILDSFLYGEESLNWAKGRKDVRIVRGDTRHIGDLMEAMQGVDAVVHLAELVGDSACKDNPSLALQTNYLATRLIASICKHLQINRLVYLSSCSVYGASKNGELLHEGSKLSPVSLYARMKIESEKALLEMIDENFSPTILRLATVYGASWRPRFDLVVNTLSAKAAVDREIPIFGGSQWRPHVHVADVGRAIIAVLESPIEKVREEIFNTGSNEQNYTVEDLGKIIHRLNPKAKLKLQKGSKDHRDYRVNFSKISAKLAFKTSKNVAQGVREIQDLLFSGKVKNYRDKRYSNHTIT